FVLQAEDGIRDPLVTGVQTCALPISEASASISPIGVGMKIRKRVVQASIFLLAVGPHPHRELTLMRRRRLRMAVSAAWPSAIHRSEERRVGTEGRAAEVGVAGWRHMA